VRGSTSWAAWLCRQAPVEPLCIYRAGIGIICAAQALAWLPHSAELFSSEGFHCGPLASWAPPPRVALALCTLLVVSSAAVAIGAFTKTALLVTVGTGGFLYALDRTNEKANSSIALVTMTLLFFSPCAARISVDSWLRARHGSQPAPAAASMLVQRLLQIEFTQIYLVAGALKVLSPQWRSGEALTGALRSRWATELGVWVSGWLSPRAAHSLSLATIVFELGVPLLLWMPRNRAWVIAAALAFHAGIQSTLQVGALGFHFAIALLVLFPAPEAVAGALSAVQRRLFRPRVNP
jgi:hypothetical protein